MRVLIVVAIFSLIALSFATPLVNYESTEDRNVPQRINLRVIGYDGYRQAMREADGK